MKKKLLALLLVVVSMLVLVACSSKDDLSGKYYGIDYKGEKNLALEIAGDSGTIEVDGATYSITNIDTDKKQLTVNAGSDYILPYSYDEDGKLTITEDSLYGSSAKIPYYKEDSEALKKAVDEAKKDD